MMPPPLPVPAPHVISRGSAPRGTFQIPDSGLPPAPDSFLTRFRTACGIAQPPPPPPQSVQPPPPSTDVTASVAHPKSVPAQVPPLQSAPSPYTDTSRPSLASLQTDTTNTKSAEQVADEAEDTLIKVLPDTDADTDVGTDVGSAADFTSNLDIASNPDPASNSDVALPDISLSYPVLRFCSAHALLDQDALDALGLPLGFVWSPFGPLPEVSRVTRAPPRCGTCAAFLARGNGADEIVNGARVWTCAFCGRNDNAAAGVPPEGAPELVADVVEYVHSEPTRPSALPGVVVLIVDENVDATEVSWARAATAAVHAAAVSRGLRFLLLSVGSGCSVAVRGDDNGDAETTPVLDMMSVARASRLSATEKDRFFLKSPPMPSNVELDPENTEVLEKFHKVTDSFIVPRAPYGEEVTQVSPDEMAESQNEDGEKRGSPEPKRRIREEPRRLDVAIFIALELISGITDSENSRILSLLTGPPTLSEHALRQTFIDKDGQNIEGERQNGSQVTAALTKLYEQVGSRAGEMRVALDFLSFGGSNEFGGQILLGAAKRSRGGLVYCAAHSFSSAASLAEAATYLVQRSTTPGVVSIRVSSPLVVARVIGPAYPTAAPHTYAVPGIDPTAGFTIILKTTTGVEDEKDVPSHTVIQLAAKSGESTRVVTARVPVTRDPVELLEGLDPEVCALVLGKACVVSGGALTRPGVASKSIDEAVRRLLHGSEASVGVARLLYELRRGTMLDGHLSPDAALVLRACFLRAECGIASLLMSPRLFTNATSERETGLMGEVALERLHVKKDAVLVLDTGFNVFVFVGEEASESSELAISQSAQVVAAQRVSPCQLWKLRSGEEAAYVLNSYLSASKGAEGSRDMSAVERGFMPYCEWLAPKSEVVKALRSAAV